MKATSSTQCHDRMDDGQSESTAVSHEITQLPDSQIESKKPIMDWQQATNANTLSLHFYSNVNNYVVYSLEQLETQICPGVIKMVTPQEYARIPLEQKQKQFVETVTAIRAIICRKLYRDEGYDSLQTYFLSKWDVSRAQVYRLMDCWPILTTICKAHVIPYKERLCRTLKQCTRSPSELVLLWDNVIGSCDPAFVSPKFIFDVWDRLQSTLHTFLDQDTESSDTDPLLSKPGPHDDVSNDAATSEKTHQAAAGLTQSSSVTNESYPPCASSPSSAYTLSKTSHTSTSCHSTAAKPLPLSSDLFSDFDGSTYDWSQQQTAVITSPISPPSYNINTTRISSCIHASDDLTLSSPFSSPITPIKISTQSEPFEFLQSSTSNSVEVGNAQSILIGGNHQSDISTTIPNDTSFDQFSDVSINLPFKEGIGSSIQPLNVCAAVSMATPYTDLPNHNSNSSPLKFHTTDKLNDSFIFDHFTDPDELAILNQANDITATIEGFIDIPCTPKSIKHPTVILPNPIENHFATSPGMIDRRRIRHPFDNNHQYVAQRLFHCQSNDNASTFSFSKAGLTTCIALGDSDPVVNSPQSGMTSIKLLEPFEPQINQPLMLSATANEEFIFCDLQATESQSLFAHRDKRVSVHPPESYSLTSAESDPHTLMSPPHRFELNGMELSNSLTETDRKISGQFQSLMPALTLPLNATPGPTYQEIQLTPSQFQSTVHSDEYIDICLTKGSYKQKGDPSASFNPFASLQSTPSSSDLDMCVARLRSAWNDAINLGCYIQPFVGAGWHTNQILNWRIKLPESRTVLYHEPLHQLPGYAPLNSVPLFKSLGSCNDQNSTVPNLVRSWFVPDSPTSISLHAQHNT
ncbi:hypothetical protein BDV3_001916 [Batrachochytrium dendrobatidis]